MAENLQQVYREAIDAHEQGEYLRAVELYAVILEAHPDADLVLYNRGLALYELGRYAEAGTAFGRAAAIRGDDADTWFNLALALKQQGRFQEALHGYEQALELQPGSADILYNLANCCREAGEPEQAVSCYEKLLTIEPDHLTGINNFAGLCHRMGDSQRARELYRLLLKLCPDHPGARHMLAALDGTASTTPSSDYVRELFDHYSDHFEQSLVDKLDYRVPELLLDLCSRFAPDRVYGNCIDLGCGTGLAGVVFRPLCDRLVGVDLSEKMVHRAGEKKLYDLLAAGNIVDYLTGQKSGYDLFVAADVLTYMADLAPVFDAVARKANPGALFIFSTEHGENSDWQVRSTGRFAHHRDYVVEVVSRCGGELLCFEAAELRREGADWIAGDIYLVRFPAGLSTP